MSLTKTELEHFHKEGYVAKPAIFSEEDLQPIKAAFSEIVDTEAKRIKSEGRLENIHSDAPFGNRLAHISNDNPEAASEIVQAVMGPGGGGFKGPALFQMLVHSPLLSCIESLVGPTIIGSSVYRVRPKLPIWERGEVPWHQDSGYFLPHCDQYLIVTCWIPLIDVTTDNGCLHVIPRTHEQGVLRHYTGGHGGYLEIPPAELPHTEPIPMEMKAGDVLFLTNLTLHASFHNRTNQVRWSIDLRYQGPEAPNNVGETPESYAREREAVTMACYPPEADFIIRQPENPEQEVKTADEFRRIRARYERARPQMSGRGWTRLTDRGQS